MKGWLVNNCLTCIPGVETFWHDLLEWFPNLEAKTIGKTNTFAGLAEFVENEAKIKGIPDYIIRNATFFRPLNLKTKTICYLQDCYTGAKYEEQLKVCNTSDLVVCNSPYIHSKYVNEIDVKTEVIPIGTDFDFFMPFPDKQMLRSKLSILEDSILFIGSTNKVKGFDKILKLINETDYNFCLVMKDNFTINHPRVKVFNKVNHSKLLEIINSCKMLVCSSNTETLHLAGVEAAACGLPIVATNVGIYYDWKDGPWGRKVVNNFIEKIKEVFVNYDSFNSRNYFLERGLDKTTCKERWLKLIN